MPIIVATNFERLVERFAYQQNDAIDIVAISLATIPMTERTSSVSGGDTKGTTSSSSILLSGLEKVESDLPAFSEWLFSRVERHLGGRVLDAGAGVGDYTRRILESGREAVALEPDPEFAAELMQRLAYSGRLQLLLGDLEDSAVISEVRKAGVDSAICLNVLEHIPDDVGALSNLREALPGGGMLCLLVPAHPILFNRIDRAIGHFRRYTKDELLRKVRQAGFSVEQVFYFNFFAIPGWIVSGHVLRRPLASRLGTRVFDRLVPIFRILERLLLRGRFGISLIVICRRP